MVNGQNLTVALNLENGLDNNDDSACPTEAQLGEIKRMSGFVGCEMVGE